MTTKLRLRHSDEPYGVPSLAAMESFRRSGKVLLWAVFVLPICSYALVVLFAPTNVFDQVPALKGWSDWIRSLLLTKSGGRDIYAHARSTSFPQVAMLNSALGVSIAWYAALMFTIRGIVSFNEFAYFSAQQPTDSVKRRLLSAFLLPIAGVMAMWAFYCLKGDPGFAAGFTTNGRGGYLFISAIAISAFSVGVGNALFSFRFLFYRTSKRVNHE